MLAARAARAARPLGAGARGRALGAPPPTGGLGAALARAGGQGRMPRGVKKENLPQKVCVVCGRPFTWRKKWERCWDEVTTCSKSCNARRRKGQRACAEVGGAPSSGAAESG